MVSEQEIVERLFEVYKLNRRYAEQKYGRFMPGRGQFNCLLVLDEKGTLTQKDLAAYLAIRSTSTGELLKKLADLFDGRRKTSLWSSLSKNRTVLS